MIKTATAQGLGFGLFRAWGYRGPKPKELPEIRARTKSVILTN